MLRDATILYGDEPEHPGTGMYIVRDFLFDFCIGISWAPFWQTDQLCAAIQRGASIQEAKASCDLPEVPNFGVCDSIEQFLSKFGSALRSHPKSFCVSFTKICKSNEPSYGGWRWHKWGPYVGEQEPTTEYIHDEPIIESVLCFHVYQYIPQESVKGALPS